jgi:hypothetical protein
VASSHSLLRVNFLRNAVSAYTIHIMHDDKSIPSSASLALSGWGYALFILLALLSIF